MSTDSSKVQLFRQDPGTDNNADVAINPLDLWAIHSPHASAADSVIVVTRTEKSSKFSWNEVAISKLEAGIIEGCYRPSNGRNRGSLAVKVGERFIDPAAEEWELFRNRFYEKQPICMREPNSWQWGAVRVTVVKMINPKDHQLYALARPRNGDMAPHEDMMNAGRVVTDTWVTKFSQGICTG